MHILMVSVGSFVINWIISNGLQCEMREILYSKIKIHVVYLYIYGISVWDGNAFHTANKEK